MTMPKRTPQDWEPLEQELHAAGVSAAALGVSIARISQIEHGEVASFEVIARYVEALGGRLDLVADFGDRTVRLPVSDTTATAA
jgi:transcriptional regulator with XRE-family HTH domain